MKKFRMFSVLVIMVMMFNSATVALAYSSASQNGSSTPFKSTRIEPFTNTTWTCSGAHVVKRNSAKDSETCLISGDTTGFIVGTYSGNPTGIMPPYPFPVIWSSDYDLAIATSWTIILSDNGNGTFTANIVAYY